MAYLSRNLSTARMFLLNRLGYTSQYRMGINFPNGKIFFVTKIRTVTKKYGIRFSINFGQRKFIPQMDTFGERLKAIRGKQSRDDFATQLGIHAQTLYRYEKGERNPDIDFIRSVVEKIGVELEWLVFGGNSVPHRVSEQRPPEKTAMSTQLRPVENVCSHCTKLEIKLDKVEKQRDEAIEENRLLHRENAELLRSNGDLREKLALMEGRMEAARGETEQEEPPLCFDKKQAIPSSSHTSTTYK